MDLLAYRIEFLGKGPFWDERSLKRVIRYCRKATPEWKKEDIPCSTFVEHYIAHADSPYDSPEMAFYLDRISEGNQSLGFGFLSATKMKESLGLDNPLYLRQFEYLLKNLPGFRLVVYLVRPLAVSLSEVLFRWTDAEIIEQVDSYKELSGA